MGSPSHDEVFARVEQCLRENDYPWVETPEVTEVFDASDRTVRERLNDLEKEERIDVRQCGASAKVWYIAERYSPHVSAASPSSETQ